jgi:hypothetical protein
MKNWKTLLGGVLIAVGTIAGPVAEKRLPTLNELFVVTGALGLGNSAKDKDVTGAGARAYRMKDSN